MNKKSALRPAYLPPESKVSYVSFTMTMLASNWNDGKIDDEFDDLYDL